MNTVIFRTTSFFWLACLVIIPIDSEAGSLREEAAAYRAEGFEAQQRGDMENALSLYQKAGMLDPSYPTPYNDAGILLEQLDRPGEAEQSYKEALKIDPNHLEAHANLAMLYEKLLEKEKAIYHWLKRYELGNPRDPWTARAEERLVALGVLDRYPGLKGKIYTRRHVLDEELKAHAQSLEEYRSVTNENGWR